MIKCTDQSQRHEDSEVHEDFFVNLCDEVSSCERIFSKNWGNFRSLSHG
jgi:hypothetical protein